MANKLTRFYDKQRLSLALLTALTVHVVIILGINFTAGQERLGPQPVFSLNVALVQQQGGDPDDAQAAQPLPPPTADPTPTPDRAAATSVAAGDPEPVVTTANPDPASAPLRFAPEVAALPAAQTAASVAPPAVTTALLEPRRPDTDRSRSKLVRPDDKTTPEGQYSERWKRYAEKMAKHYIGRQARLQRLTGRLTLDIGIRADGTLHSIELLQSSGYRELDNAARRIVMLATPFEPFSDSLRRHYDVLHIIRTWEFDHGRRR